MSVSLFLHGRFLLASQSNGGSVDHSNHNFLKRVGTFVSFKEILEGKAGELAQTTLVLSGVPTSSDLEQVELQQ